MTILRWNINMMPLRHSKKRQNFDGFLCQYGVFFSKKICFKIRFETMSYILKLITITLVVMKLSIYFFVGMLFSTKS